VVRASALSHERRVAASMRMGAAFMHVGGVGGGGPGARVRYGGPIGRFVWVSCGRGGRLTTIFVMRIGTCGGGTDE
jgi:hypothetical protein